MDFKMTRDDIIRMVREVWTDVYDVESYERFATLVAAASASVEREACAKVCDAQANAKEQEGTWLWEARKCAAAIRTRGETK